MTETAAESSAVRRCREVGQGGRGDNRGVLVLLHSVHIRTAERQRKLGGNATIMAPESITGAFLVCRVEFRSS